LFHLFALLLPGLIPSWKFFKAIEPSPRVQWRWLADPVRPQGEWQEFRPRPQRVGPLDMARRLFWNPHWNEALYLVSLAERLTLAPTEHSEREIVRRIADELGHHADGGGAAHMQFRLVFVQRQGNELVEQTTFLSDPYRLKDIAP
jgi:hypothetical protein